MTPTPGSSFSKAGKCSLKLCHVPFLHVHHGKNRNTRNVWAPDCEDRLHAGGFTFSLSWVTSVPGSGLCCMVFWGSFQHSSAFIDLKPTGNPHELSPKPGEEGADKATGRTQQGPPAPGGDNLRSEVAQDVG